MNLQNIISLIDDFCIAITKKTVIVLDNTLIDRSILFKAKIKEWNDKHLIILFLPTYSPELNRDEILWSFIKYNWLLFDIFLNFQDLKDQFISILQNFDPKDAINFY